MFEFRFVKRFSKFELGFRLHVEDPPVLQVFSAIADLDCCTILSPLIQTKTQHLPTDLPYLKTKIWIFKRVYQSEDQKGRVNQTQLGKTHYNRLVIVVAF